jgi:hypothetical protein
MPLNMTTVSFAHFSNLRLFIVPSEYVRDLQAQKGDISNYSCQNTYALHPRLIGNHHQKALPAIHHPGLRAGPFCTW